MKQGFIDLIAVGRIVFEYEIKIELVFNYKAASISIESAYFKDTGLTIPKSEHDWIETAILDEVHAAYASGKLKRPMDDDEPDDIIWEIERYLEGAA